MNRSDSEEMAGRLLPAGCAEAAGLETADLIVINTCAIREGAEQKVIGRQGQLARLKAANPALRVVLTGCSVREPRPGRPAPPLSGGRPVPAPGRGARARRPARPGVGAGAASAPVGARPRSSAGPSVGVADRLPATRAPAVEAGTVARGSAISAWLPIIYGCDKTCTYCIVPFSRGPERSRPFDEIVDEARVARGGRLPRGHAARPERQLVRPRPRARAALRPRRRGALGRPPARPRTAGRTSPS